MATSGECRGHGVERCLNPAWEAAVVPLIGGMSRLVLAGFARS